MAGLKEPKLGQQANRSITKIFNEIGEGITILVVYAIVWMIIGVMGYHIYQWIM
jgi:hypothetical protein